MKGKWDTVYLPRGLPNIYSISLIPRPVPLYLFTATITPLLYTWRPRSSYFRDALGGCDRSSLEMHWEAVIEWVWGCTWKPGWGELRDTFGGGIWVSLDMDMEAEIEWSQRCTLQLWPSEFGDEHAGCDRARSEEYMEVVNLDWGAMVAKTRFIGWLVIVGI